MGQIENDNYPTPQRLARAIVQNEKRDGVEPAVVIEPSCGAGAFISAAREAWPQARIIGVDIVGSYRNRALHSGATEFVQADWARVAAGILEVEREYGMVLVIGNPPFSFAQQHIEAALAAMNEGDRLSFLLRASFLGGQDRTESFWRPQWQNFDSYTPICGRPSYVVFERDAEGRRKKKTKTDNSEYRVYRFMKSGPNYMNLSPSVDEPLSWKEEAA